MHLKDIKLFVFISIIFSAILIILYVFLLKPPTKMVSERSVVQLNYTVVHIDLKGAPLKIEYLKHVLGYLRNMQVNAVLMEYEDMFPFDGKLDVIRTSNAYSKQDLLDFFTLANDYEIEIIPLVQTFGHMEFVLKHKRFHSLRESTQSSTAICPSRNSSLDLIKMMIKQVLDLHSLVKPVNIFHIGCDEVFHLNSCKDCKKRNLLSRDVFAQHVKTVSSFVQEYDQNIRVLIWDDMLRRYDPVSLKELDLHRHVEPVVWSYQQVLNDVKHRTWYVYGKVFDKIWIASAFKGADGRWNQMPDLEERYYNTLSWLELINSREIPKSLQFQGIFLTGWSRYTHTDKLCDTFPASVPSLFLNVLLIQTYLTEIDLIIEKQIRRSVMLKLLDKLKCPNNTADYKRIDGKKNNLELLERNLKQCNFHENLAYRLFYWIKRAASNLEQSSFYSKKRNSNTNDLLDYVNGIKKISVNLKDYFDEKTNKEILNTVVKPVINKVKRRLRIMRKKMEFYE